MDTDNKIESFYDYDEGGHPSFLNSPSPEVNLLTQKESVESNKEAVLPRSLESIQPENHVRADVPEDPCSPIPMEEDDKEENLAAQGSQSQRIYSGLLSRPEFDVYDDSDIGSIMREVRVSQGFQSYTLQDFLVKGPKVGPVRGNAINQAGNMCLNRQTKTFFRRLNEYKPILEGKISGNAVWRRYKRIQSVLSMSTLGTVSGEGEEENQEMRWGWDDDQGIGFRVYEEPIVLVGYITKKVPPDLRRLHERCKDIGVIPIPLKRRDDWCLYLEDETGRMRIGLTKQREERVNFDEIVSGIPAAIVGTSSKGRFWVEDVLFATPNEPEWPIVDQSDAVEMVFVSGLNFGSGENYAHLDLLMDYLQGLSGSCVEQSAILKHKTRVFFVGNIFSKKTKWDTELGETLAIQYAKNVSKLDDMLEDVARTMEVFILPGKLDLTHQEASPQPPFHRQLFPLCTYRRTFHRLTNPSKITVSLATPPNEEELLLQNSIIIEESQLDIVLTSGTNVSDTMDKCEIECPLSMSAKLLEWGHLNPTSLEECDLAEELYCLKGTLPHLLVVGGLCEFGEKVWKGCKIIGVPSFADTGIAVTLTKNCDVVPVNFKICNFSTRR